MHAIIISLFFLLRFFNFHMNTLITSVQPEGVLLGQDKKKKSKKHVVALRFCLCGVNKVFVDLWSERQKTFLTTEKSILSFSFIFLFFPFPLAYCDHVLMS